MKTVFDAQLIEQPADPACLPEALANHRRHVAMLRVDLAVHGTMVDQTRLARELHKQGVAMSLAGHHAGAIASLDEAIEHFERLGRHRAVWWVRARRAWVRERSGDTGAAEAALTALLESASPQQHRAYGEAVHRWRARARLVRGDRAGARSDLEAALALVCSRPRPTGVDALQCALDSLTEP